MLKGKHILVTGATSGIGEATFKLIMQYGGIPYITGRNEGKLKQLSETYHLKNHQIYPADLTNDTAIENITKSINKLDGVVNAAGIVLPVPIKFIKRKHINDLLNINLTAQILLTASLFKNKKINNNASLVYISSISSKHPYFGGSLYVSSKAAIEAFSRSVALEYASKKIRANVVAPGLVKTNIFEATLNASSKEEVEKYEQQYPLGFGEPEDVAEMICFLLSDKSKWITGQTFFMDGGLTLASK
jgi:NAD(P)-dependent dehydrogenase (short-subunit alcohol dehydrogenase family)